MPTPSQTAFISRTISHLPTLNFPSRLAELDAEVRDLVYAIVVAVDTFNSDITEIGSEAVSLNMFDPDVFDVAYVAGNQSDYGRGLFVHGAPLALQPDIVSTLTRQVVAAARRALNEARPVIVE